MPSACRTPPRASSPDPSPLVDEQQPVAEAGSQTVGEDLVAKGACEAGEPVP
jgi:hypothetical protein